MAEIVSGMRGYSGVLALAALMGVGQALAFYNQRNAAGLPPLSSFIRDCHSSQEQILFQSTASRSDCTQIGKQPFLWGLATCLGCFLTALLIEPKIFPKNDSLFCLAIGLPMGLAQSLVLFRRGKYWFLVSGLSWMVAYVTFLFLSFFITFGIAAATNGRFSEAVHSWGVTVSFFVIGTLVVGLLPGRFLQRITTDRHI